MGCTSSQENQIVQAQKKNYSDFHSLNGSPNKQQNNKGGQGGNRKFQDSFKSELEGSEDDDEEDEESEEDEDEEDEEVDQVPIKKNTLKKQNRQESLQKKQSGNTFQDESFQSAGSPARSPKKGLQRSDSQVFRESIKHLPKDEQELLVKREEIRKSLAALKKELTKESNQLKNQSLKSQEDMESESGSMIKKSTTGQVLNRFRESIENQQQQQLKESLRKELGKDAPKGDNELNNDPAGKKLVEAIDSYKDEVQKMKESLKNLDVVSKYQSERRDNKKSQDDANTLTMNQLKQNYDSFVKIKSEREQSEYGQVEKSQITHPESLQNQSIPNNKQTHNLQGSSQDQITNSQVMQGMTQDSRVPQKQFNNQDQFHQSEGDSINSPQKVQYIPKKPSDYTGFQKTVQNQKGKAQKQQQEHETGVSPRTKDEEDQQDQYYNFDKPVISSTALLGKNYGPENLTFKHRKTDEYNNLQMQTKIQKAEKKLLSQMEMSKLKQEFEEQEERDRLNPQNVLIRVLFIYSFIKEKDEEQNLERKLYTFFVNKNSIIKELKEKIKNEFGFDPSQQKFYHKYRELPETQYIMSIKEYDSEVDILICITLDHPKYYKDVVLREPIDDIKVADVKLLNSTDRGNHIKQEYKDMKNFDYDQDKLPWPLYRDWTAESSFLLDTIVENQRVLFSDSKYFELQQNCLSQIQESKELKELIEAEIQFKKLADEFKNASIFAVHQVVRRNPSPLNLFNLFGDECDKYIVGGILIKRAKNWSICGQSLSDVNNVYLVQDSIDPSINLSDISAKVASLDVRNMSILRNQIDNLVVPLSCIVDYYGLKFETIALAPLSINSLVYGSDTDGLLFQNAVPDGQFMAEQIAKFLNIKPHSIEEKATGKNKKAFLPYTVQIHKNRDLINDPKVYLINAYRLFPLDEALRKTKESQEAILLDIMSKQLRPELCISNNKGEIEEGFKQMTWKSPRNCDECGEIIQEYLYYYFEKKSLDKSQRVIQNYFCCVSCFEELAPSEKLKVALHKLQRKELPPKERLEYWQNLTMRTFLFVLKEIDSKFEKFKLFREKLGEQEEILRTSQRIKDEILEQLVEDLNNVDEDPQSPQELEEIMHKRGLNMRYLGKVCSSVKPFLQQIQAQLNHIREIAVIDVITRSAKLLIRDGLTFLADDEETGFKQDNINKCVLHYLQEIFNFDEIKSTSTQNIWDFITDHARKKFQITVEREILNKIHLTQLLQNITQKLNIELNREIQDIEFHSVSQNDKDNQSFISLKDIKKLAPTAKDYYDKTIEIQTLWLSRCFPMSYNFVLQVARERDELGKRSQWFMIGGPEREEATELFRIACQVCEQIYTNQSLHYAKVLIEIGKQLESRHQERGRPENSRWNRSFAIPEDELSMESRYFFQNALQTLTEIGKEMSLEAAIVHTALARLFKPRSNVYDHYREQDDSINTIFKNLMDAITIYEIILGFDHPETGDAYTKMALAYQENGNFMAASPWIRRAFSIFYKSFGAHDEITLNAYEYLKIIEVNIDSSLDQVPYDDLPQLIYDLERQQKGLGKVPQSENNRKAIQF